MQQEQGVKGLVVPALHEFRELRRPYDLRPDPTGTRPEAPDVDVIDEGRPGGRNPACGKAVRGSQENSSSFLGR